MFEKMKADAWLEGYNKGIDEAEELREMEQQSDGNGITYASHGDYMKAKVAFNAKDTEIADLSNKVRELEKQVANSSKTRGSHKTELDKCHKELERFYLKAIGDCRTVKQVNAVVRQYTASPIRPEVYGTDIISNLKKFIDEIRGDIPHNQILDAAATKIKRINKRDASEVCDLLDTLEDNNYYASGMASTLKEVAGVEVDRTKILEAKQTGLDAWNVLLSMLSVYGVKADSVLEVK